MKHLILLSLFTFHFSLFTLSASAAVPLKWTVETSRATPAQFEAYQGETLALEAALQSDGKPLEAPSNYSLYWQTNGMGNVYWSVPCTQPNSNTLNSNNSNTLFAIWSPTNDVGAKVYNCFIGQPGAIYHAAFQLRLRPSPGATPNELPLPQKVIDFAKVTVLNPPWSGGGGGGGVDTNAVRDIVRPMIGAATNGLRRVDDLAVYTNEFSRWTLTADDGRSMAGYSLEHASSTTEWNPTGNDCGGGVGKGDLNSTQLHWNANEWGGGFQFTATRTKSLVPGSDSLATTNGVNAAIEAHHDDTKMGKSGTQNIETSWQPTYNGEPLFFFDLYYWQMNANLMKVPWGSLLYKPTTLSGYGITDPVVLKSTDGTIDNDLGFRVSGAPDAAWSKIKAHAIVGGELVYQVLPDYLASGEWDTNTGTNRFARLGDIPPTSETIRTYDRVRQCWWVLEMVNGVPTWTVED